MVAGEAEARILGHGASQLAPLVSRVGMCPLSFLRSRPDRRLKGSLDRDGFGLRWVLASRSYSQVLARLDASITPYTSHWKPK